MAAGMSTIGNPWERWIDDVDIVYNDGQRSSGLSRFYARADIIANTEMIHIEKHAIDVEAFIDLTRKRYRRLILPKFVLNSEDFKRLNVRDIQKTSLTVKKIKLTGPDGNISKEARTVMDQFYAVSVKSLSADDFFTIFSVDMSNLAEIAIPHTPQIHITIGIAHNYAPNMRRLTVNSDTPIQICWFRNFHNLVYLELEAVADDDVSAVGSPSALKVLIINNCSHAKSFIFLLSLNRLQRLMLNNAPQLKYPSLCRALTVNLESLAITEGTRILYDCLLDDLITFQTRLSLLKLPLEPDAAVDRSLSMNILWKYVKADCGLNLN
jgi:hypothetical protein